MGEYEKYLAMGYTKQAAEAMSTYSNGAVRRPVSNTQDQIDRDLAVLAGADTGSTEAERELLRAQERALMHSLYPPGNIGTITQPWDDTKYGTFKVTMEQVPDPIGGLTYRVKVLQKWQHSIRYFFKPWARYTKETWEYVDSTYYDDPDDGKQWAKERVSRAREAAYSKEQAEKAKLIEFIV